MCIDKNQFIVTANGLNIRLFPYNYNILTRGNIKHRWEVNLDPKVDAELADGIRAKLLRSPALLWYDKGILISTLTALLPEEEQPHGPHHSTDWDLEEEVQGQFIWVRWAKGIEVFNATPTECPPTTNAGYMNRDSLLKLKGVTA